MSEKKFCEYCGNSLDRHEPEAEQLPELMSYADFARHMNVSASTVTNWVKAGIPIMPISGSTNRIKVRPAIAWLESRPWAKRRVA